MIVQELQPRRVPAVSTKYRRIVTEIPVPESIPILERLRQFEPRSMGISFNPATSRILASSSPASVAQTTWFQVSSWMFGSSCCTTCTTMCGNSISSSAVTRLAPSSTM